MEITKPITLAQLADGAAGERFDLTLKEVLENALDPNRPIDAVRSVTLVISFVPEEGDGEVASPRSASMGIEVKAKLAPLKAIGKHVHFGRNKETGEPVALLLDPDQHQLFVGDKIDEKILSIAAAEKQRGGGKS